MASSNLDKIHKERVNAVAKEWRDGGNLPISDIFVSERVFDSLHTDKALVESFRLPEILSLAPFTESIYVEMCPHCVDSDNFDGFRKLVQSGIIIPLLIGPYKLYPDSVVSFIQGYDHVSCYEYALYRNAIIQHVGGGGLCGHCIGKREDELKHIIKGKRGAPKYRKYIDRVKYNLTPYISPDFELFDDLEAAFIDRDVERVMQLREMSEAIRSVRTSQAFSASITLDESNLSMVPEGTTTESDQARNLALQLKQHVSQGLGLTIPTDINLEQYVELITDFRPQVTELNRQILDMAVTDGELSIKRLSQSIANINSEISRIKGLKRYMLYEAGVEFVGKNKALVTSAFVASALGLAGSLVGCAATASAGAAANIANKKGKLKTGKSIARLGRKIHRDLQPSIDTLIAKYLSTDIPTMRIISLRKAVSDEQQKANK